MDLEKIFEQINSEILTDEVKLQISTIFEAKVNEAIAAKEAELEESNRAEIAEFKEGLIGQMDEYLNYFVEEYVRDNDALVSESVQIDLSRKVLTTFAEMVDNFNIALSPSKLDETEKVTELKAQLNDRVNEAIELKREIIELSRKAFIADKAQTLTTDSERAKFSKLAESLTFEDEISFGKKLTAIAETVKARPAEKKEKLVEDKKVEDKVVIEEKSTELSIAQKYAERL